MSVAETIHYYNSFGSRWGYKLIFGGHRHFGYYRDKKYWSMARAAVAMIDHLAEYAEIKPGDRVLDAGCGEGRTSLRLAEKYGADVTGVDVVPVSIDIANERAKDTTAKVNYLLNDYNKLPFPDKTFDVIFTLETFTHSPDPHKTLQEFWRVLKPGGRIVLFDYSVGEFGIGPKEYDSAIKNIAMYTDCPSFIVITHGYYEKHLPGWGMKDFEVVDATADIMPALKQAFYLSWPVYWTLKLLGKVNHHPNTLIGHFGWQGARLDLFRYIQVKIRKPKQ